MGDMGDDFRWLREQKKNKKIDNKIASTLMLQNEGIKFESKNDGLHLIVTGLNGEVFDFWPSTGLFRKRSNDHYSRGVRKLLRQCKR